MVRVDSALRRGLVVDVALEGGIRRDVREIPADPYTVSEKIEMIVRVMEKGVAVHFSELFEDAMSRSEVVCTFLALLELIRLKQLVCGQSSDFGEIEIRKRDAVVPLSSTPEPPATNLTEAAAPAPVETPTS